jgi:hypothetical protein
MPKTCVAVPEIWIETSSLTSWPGQTSAEQVWLVLTLAKPPDALQVPAWHL